MASLSANLKHDGHTVRLIDLQAETLSQKALGTILSKESPDIVGITAMTPTLGMAFDIAQLSKSLLPKVPVVFGGVHPTVSPESVFEHTSVDFIVRGEGEEVLRLLFKQGIDNPENIPGVCWRQDDGTCVIAEKAPLIKDITKLVPPDYTSFPVERYVEYIRDLRGIRGISMIVTRGCPYQCSFCTVKETMGTLWRRLDPTYAVELMLKLCTDFDLEGIWFKDSIFNFSFDWTKTFAQALIAQKNPYQFQINTRVDLVRQEELSLLKEAGLRQVDLGIESGSSKSLQKLKKNITRDQIVVSVKLLKRAGIQISGFFMIGIPGETEEDVAETISLVKELDLDRASVSIYTPLPGSELYNQLFLEGRITNDPNAFVYHHFTEAQESFCDIPIERLKNIYEGMNRLFCNKIFTKNQR
ncbi:MAG: B12-binding domain-containing radical SAM protein [Candidatus Omnitrophica bacterium]|nr:B12-binding domain-containing radical SAM protein [Candidatus Omnitrophota bacterium]